MDSLNKICPCLTSTLKEHLMQRYRISADAARQRIHRLKGVRTLKGLTFPKKAAFIYFDYQYDSESYWFSLYRAIDESKSQYSIVLAAVRSRAIVPLCHFKAVSGAPIAQKKKISYANALERLKEVGILVEVSTPIGFCITTKEESKKKGFDSLVNEVRSRLEVEKLVLENIKIWLKNLGLISFNSAKTRVDALNFVDEPSVGPYAWDLTAPSYLSPFTTFVEGGKVLPGFLVCDVFMGSKVSKQDIVPFLNKVRNLLSLKNQRPTLFLFVAKSYEEDAFKELKTIGCVPATLKNVFGSEVDQVLSLIQETYEALYQNNFDIERIANSLSELKNLRGYYGNIKGALFEFVVAHIIREEQVGNLKMNHKCKSDSGEEAEIDIFIEGNYETFRVIECKGISHGSLLCDDEVKRWLNTRIDRVYEYLRREKGATKKKHPLPIFELWLTGNLSKQSREFIEKKKIAHANYYDIKIIQKLDMCKMKAVAHNKEIQNILKRF